MNASQNLILSPAQFSNRIAHRWMHDFRETSEKREIREMRRVYETSWPSTKLTKMTRELDGESWKFSTAIQMKLDSHRMERTTVTFGQWTVVSMAIRETFAWLIAIWWRSIAAVVCEISNRWSNDAWRIWWNYESDSIDWFWLWFVGAVMPSVVQQLSGNALINGSYVWRTLESSRLSRCQENKGNISFWWCNWCLFLVKIRKLLFVDLNCRQIFNEFLYLMSLLKVLIKY